jgi:hypothetical protein
MEASLYPITEAGLRAWIEAVLVYQSQLSSVFEDPEKIEGNIRSYYSKRNGFPLWKIK